MASFCEGKVAVVTGAGGTLCSCIAKDLALKGAKVVLIGRTREKLEKVASEITGGSRSCATADAQERVPPKQFTIIARNLSRRNKYVRSATLNGKPLEGPVIRHADIVAGGELVFEMER